MAEKRMFAKSIVLSDNFLDMPASSRCLYFTLSMFGDDDGFVNAPKSVMRQCGATVDDFKILVSKNFIIPFETGVIVIKHWRINNYLRSDRYNPSKQMEKALLLVQDDGSYELKTEVKTVEETKKVSFFKEKKTKSTNKEVAEMEQVEQLYFDNYVTLYKKGLVNLEKPIYDFATCRKTIKNCIKKFGFEKTIDAVKKSINNDFCLKTGYMLTTILSNGVFAQLINGKSSSTVDLSDKYDMGDLL